MFLREGASSVQSFSCTCYCEVCQAQTASFLARRVLRNRETLYRYVYTEIHILRRFKEHFWSYRVPELPALRNLCKEQPQRQATAYRNLNGTERKCVSSLYIHIYSMHGYVINYFASFYNLSLCTCILACINVHECRHTCMYVVHVLCVCIMHMTACMHIFFCMFSYSYVAYLKNDHFQFL